MMSYLDQRTIILAARKPFPEKFGLRAFPGDTFRISERDSYVNDSGDVQLYTEVLRGDKWLSFAKGTPAELAKEVVADPNAPVLPNTPSWAPVAQRIADDLRAEARTPAAEAAGEERTRVGDTPEDEELPPDPDGENQSRAERAEKAIDAYCDATGDRPDESHFRDLLCDLMHLASRSGRDFDEELRMARSNYEEETMPSDSDEQDPGKPALERPGFIIDVPVTLSVAVRGAKLAKAKEIAREFADSLNPHDQYCAGYTSANLEQGIEITEATLESSREDSCEVLEELETPDEDADSFFQVGQPETCHFCKNLGHACIDHEELAENVDPTL